VPPFPKPKFANPFDIEHELAAIRKHRKTREVPAKADDQLLVATWNIANLGVQRRTPEAYRLIAEILGWFDLVAIQECNDNLTGLRAILAQMPKSYSAVFSGAAGNNERMAYVYDTKKLAPQEKVGGLSIPPSDLPTIKVKGIQTKFVGFDRNPYMVSWRCGPLTFLLLNVHLYFGGPSGKKLERRILETYAVAHWVDQRRRSRNAYTKNIVALGDFNLPKDVKGDPIFDELVSKGLVLPEHSTAMGSSIVKDNHYDQVAFLPGEMQKRSGPSGVFDYDSVLFRDLWNKPSDQKHHKQFFAYVRYYLSDHRPLWAQFSL
jgi:hypothetical protein